MAIRNQDWYNLNESRPYPLQDTASLRDDSGARLPSHIITDLKLRFPSTLGDFAFLSGITVTDNLVTLVISGSTSATTAAAEAPICAVTITGSILQGKPYILSPLAAGVSGWVVLGKGVEEAYAGRFASPAQSLISPRAASPYRTLPVSSMSKAGEYTRLTGIVQLLGGNDVEVIAACRAIPGVKPPEALNCGGDEDKQNVIVIRLADTQNASRNVLAEYVGSCNGRPESYNCGDPQPVEFIGSVSPDCCGNVFIIVSGCARISDVVTEVTLDDDDDVVASSSASGVVIDCSVGLSASCGDSNKLPDEDGVLPTEADGICSVVSMDLEYSEDAGDVPDAWLAIPASPAFVPAYLSLNTESLPSVSWTTQAGSWDSDVTYGFVTEQDNMPSLIIYDAIEASIAATGQLDTYFDPGGAGSLHSGGIVFGYNEANGYPEFYSLEMHWDTTQSEPVKSLRLRYWKDWYSSDINTQSTGMPELAIETPLRLEVQIDAPLSADGAELHCYGSWQDGASAWHQTELDLSGLLFRPYPTGKWGIIAHRTLMKNIAFSVY